MVDMVEALNHLTMNVDLVAGASDPGGWIDNGTDKVKEWGAKGAVFLGACCFIAALWFLARIILSKSKRGLYAGLCLAACIVGGLLIYGGMDFLQSIGSGGFNGVKDLK